MLVASIKAPAPLTNTRQNGLKKLPRAREAEIKGAEKGPRFCSLPFCHRLFVKGTQAAGW